MNKILLSSEDELNNLIIDQDSELVLNYNDKETYLNIIVEDNTCLSILEMDINTKNNIEITLKQNSKLIFNKASRDINDKILINLDGVSSSALIKTSIVSTKSSSCFFEVRHNASNTLSELHNHGLNMENEELFFKIDAFIPNDSKLCKTNQENKIINKNSGKSRILPNLIIDNDEVDATHSAFIGDFDKEVLFYLKSRGLSTKEAKDLLITGFLINNIDHFDEYEKSISEILNI